MESNICHSRTEHERRVHALCRVCGERSAKSHDQRKVKSCAVYKTDLLKFYGIDIDRDAEEKHSKLLYHGRSFVGNHCHKYLKHDVIDDVCDNLVQQVKKATESKRTRDRAAEISSKFRQLNKLFSSVHVKMSHKNPVTETDVQNTQMCVDSYMSFYRAQFPDVPIIPKQHLLEYHCIPWMRNWKFGMGLHGEQGGEQTHATLNLLKGRAWGVKNEGEQLRVILKEHMAQVSPLLHPLLPSAKRKKLL